MQVQQLFIVLFMIIGAGCQQVGGQEKAMFAIAIHGGAGKAPATQEWRQNRAEVLEQALQTGESMLRDGQSSLDTVEAVVRILEDSPFFNAAKGAVFNADGTHELDATIMDGRHRAAGAVGGVTTVKNPISLARLVMTDTVHVLLATQGSDRFADEYPQHPKIERVPNSYFSTEYQRQQLQRAQQQAKQPIEDTIGTVGCVALDTAGNLAAGTSTGGLNNKKFGRLGDSPIVGAGTFADNQTCAISCTGVGEDFMRHVVAYDISVRMEYRGDELDDAIMTVLSNKDHEVRGGVIGISKAGQISMRFNSPGMARACADSHGRREVHVSE